MKSELLLQTYGSDSSGIVCGFVFSPTQAGRPISADEALEWLRAQQNSASHADEFLWLHFNLAHSAAER